MRVTTTDIRQMKSKKEKIVAITAYDYATAMLVDESGIPLILVGDSLGMVVLGYDSTIPVTMEDMIHHTKAVCRGTKNALVVGDMPFMTYHTNTTEAMKNAARFLQEAGAQAVKLEGGEVAADTIKRLVDCGIPVMGHIGFTPQSVYQLGGYKAQGKPPEAAARLLRDALAVQQAGAFAIVLEVVPSILARFITKKLDIPTIGIGAGPDCDGQIQVINDILGTFSGFVPKHAKQFANLSPIIKTALKDYINEVKNNAFPTKQHSVIIDESIIKQLE
jgi:3-methyl-2-oxobutanoate hydroxymethyltransferase